MENNNLQLPEIKRALALKKERAEILALSPERALDGVLDHPQPAALVHSFPEEDLYFLVHDIGVEDALPLLELASHRQLDFILDKEIWQKDRIENSAVTRWFGLMLAAAPHRFVSWLKQEKTNLLEFYLYRNVEIKIRMHDQDPSDFGEDFITFDNIYYFKIIPDPTKPPVDKEEGEDEDTAEDITEVFRKELVRNLLEKIADLDHKAYQHILLESASLLPAESEEEAYRWRNVRLGEKGFVPFDEAIGIYQSMTPEDLFKKGSAIKNYRSDKNRYIHAPLMPMKMLEKGSIFSEALLAISQDERFNEIQGEFAALCNHIIVADQKIVRSKDALLAVVKKACGYINIALDRMALEPSDLTNPKEIILTYPLSHIFKVGYGTALSLKWRAKRWMKESWFSAKGLSLTFWGEDWMGVIGGLLIKKPLFFDNYETGVLYREFQSMADIQKTRVTLNHAIACDKLLSSISVELGSLPEHEYLSYKNLLLTLWAKHHLGIPVNLSPLPLEAFKKFYPNLWEEGSTPQKISGTMKTGFLDFLSDKTGLLHPDIIDLSGPLLETLFNELESEFADVNAKDVDPRMITLFLLKKQDL